MDDYVYHYTSLEALNGIIKNDICLWATRYDHLNDPHEQIWAKGTVLDYCLTLPETKDLSKEHLQKWFAKYSYILSLCDLPDYRNMWRLYCNDGAGACLTFDSSILLEQSQLNSQNDIQHTFDVYDMVTYSSKKNIKSAIDYWLDRGVFKRCSNEPADELMTLCAFIKDDDFDIENEIRYARIRENDFVRACYNPNKAIHVDFEFHADTTDVKYRLRGKEFVPFIELHFPASALKGITIGYQYDYKEMKPYIQNILRQYGSTYQHVKIEKSSLY